MWPAEVALAASLAADTAYLNIHTTNFPGGEIRGFLLFPEPATILMLVVRRDCGQRRTYSPS
jgi:CHRD domain